MTLAEMVSSEAPASDSPQPLRFPCSSAQERCWFIDALNPGNPALNVALRWELKGRFDSAAIEQAFTTIIERHETLRTRIVEDDGAPFQIVGSPFRLRVAEIDLSDLPKSQHSNEILRIGRDEAHKPFDLEQGPLIRATLLRLGSEHAFLLLTIHQIAFDGWSIRLISHEFGTIAAAIQAGRPHTLPELPLQYGDYASWQKAYFASGRFNREIDYWTKRLRDAPYFEVTGDHRRRAEPTYNGEILAQLLPDDLATAMSHAVKTHGVTLFGFGCAVVAAVLGRYTGAQDISIGTQIAGRDDADLETLIGVFINNLVLRIDLAGCSTFPQLLDRTNRVVQDALIHQRMPFHRLVELLRPPRDPSRMPLISVNFTVLQDVMENARYGTFDLIGHPSLSAGSLYDLNFFMVHWPTGWRMALEYNSDLFERSTGDALLGLWRETLEKALREPDFPLAAAAPPPRRPMSPVDPGPPSDIPKRDPPVTLPGSDTERRLAEIWRDVLRVDRIDPASNFFDFGGHSLLAMRMLSRVATSFGRKVSVSNLFMSPTLQEFAAWIMSDKPQLKDWNVVPIQAKGSRTPIIVINNTVIYYNLARKLERDRPVIGVQLYDPEASGEPDRRDFKSIVADYVGLIRAARPHGPYVLLGLCVAGSIAYEAAQQLRAAGEDAPLVIMADTWRPGFLAGLPRLQALLFGLSYRFHVAKHHIRTMAAGQATLLSVLHNYPRIRNSILFRLLRGLSQDGTAPLGMEDWGNRWFLPQLEEARDGYDPDPTEATLVVLQSDEMKTPLADARMGWGSLAGGRFFLHHVRGWHTEMFQEPHGDDIAAFLRPLLAEVDQGATNSGKRR